jgi:hypothetical protein
MNWTKLTKSVTSACSGNNDAGLPRRDLLVGLGLAGLFAVAGSALLVPSPAEARNNTPVTEPVAAPADDDKAKAAECNLSENKLADLDTADFTEFSAQWRRRYWRRRYWRGRYWRRRYWRRWRVVCRRRWIRGRLVRVCRRVWW